MTSKSGSSNSWIGSPTSDTRTPRATRPTAATSWGATDSRPTLPVYCRRGSGQAGDWLVVENKATAAYIEAGDQVADHVALVHTELARPSEQVFGLLIADGASAQVQAHLSRLSIGYASLSTLGYRRRDWPQVVRPGPAELDRFSTL